MYGIQTVFGIWKCNVWFENDVKMYGIQTVVYGINFTPVFENDVKMYGIQTGQGTERGRSGLRMM